eukprot:scaffold30799_cov50-Attheya_sp.AAC.6
MKVTYDLQMDLDEATEAKQHESTLAAYVKKSTIQAATSATQTAIDQQQALQGHPSLVNNMEHLMEEKISRLMDKQLNDRVHQHVTRVMKSWGRKNSSGGRHTNHRPSPMATHPMVPDQKGNHQRRTNTPKGIQCRVQIQRGNPKTQENATISATNLRRNSNRIRKRLSTPREETETTLPAESAKGETTAAKEIGRDRSRNARSSHHPTN